MKKLSCIFVVLLIMLQTVPFVAAKSVSTGDVNGDGIISAADARAALRLSVSLDRACFHAMQYADVNADGEYSANDARTILRVAVGLEDASSFAEITLQEPTFSRYPDDYHLIEMEIREGTVQNINNIIIREGESVTWQSSNPSSVTVTQDGEITAVAKGFACVSCTAGSEKFRFCITVVTQVQEKLNALRSKYPEGYYWNAHTPSEKYPAVTETPCSDHSAGKYSMCIGQCWCFADLISDEVFGEDAPVTYDITAETMKIGDHIRTSHHSVIITDLIKEGDVIGYDFYNEENITSFSDRVIVVHCNWYGTCNIMWDYDYTYYIYYYDSVDSYYSYTRY